MSENTNETKKCKHCQSDIPKKARVCPHCRRSQNRLVKWLIAIAIIMILLFSCADSEDNTTPTTASSEESSIESSQSEVIAQVTESKEEFIASCEEISYKTLARYPDENIGKRLVLTVKISQIIQGGLFDEGEYYRVYTDNDGYDFYFDDEYFMYDCRIDDSTKLLQDDIIKVYCEFAGTESITRALSGTAEDIPAIKAYYIDIIE